MARKARSHKAPHCKRVAKAGGGTRKMCFDAKGKITSAAKVASSKGKRR
jgi:hypothetical protein